ncbi:MAG: hypothetical protein SFV81_07165 [Pirellulaceae bacterium]|nr:hypothetical protein [Pirellulaceae bacterium]
MIPSLVRLPESSRARASVCVFAFIAMLLWVGCSPALPTAKQSAVPADALERITEKGPVKLAVHIWPSAPRLSDLVSMEIEVQFAEGVEVKPPEFGQAVGDFLIRDYSAGSSGSHLPGATSPSASLPPGATAASASSTTTKSLQSRRFRYQLEPTQTGKHLIRAIAIEFMDKRAGSENFNSPTIIESEPIEINVTSELGDAVPSLAALEPMFPPRPLEENITWLWALLAFPIAALIGWFLWRRRRQAGVIVEPVALSPAEIARAALAQLLAENLPARGLVQEFYLRLTGIVRHYIEGTTGVRAPEQTTEEFLRAMRSRQLFGVEQSIRLQDFLEAADMVKYAGQEPTAEQIELSIVRAREFVEIHLAKTEEMLAIGTTAGR